MTLHTIVTDPIFLSFWGAFGVDFWHWLSANGWKMPDGFDIKTASKRWLVGLVMGVAAHYGLSGLFPAS